MSKNTNNDFMKYDNVESWLNSALKDTQNENRLPKDFEKELSGDTVEDMDELIEYIFLYQNNNTNYSAPQSVSKFNKHCLTLDDYKEKVLKFTKWYGYY